MVSWKQIGAVGARQYGVISRRQLLEVGATAEQIRRWVGAGRLAVVHRGVYVLAGAPPTPEQTTLAAVLGAGTGAAASHASAAWLWGLMPSPPQHPEVVVPIPRSPRLVGVTVRRSTPLADDRVRVRRRIPATDPLRTMFELGASVGRNQVRDGLERGVMANLFSVAALEWMQVEMGARGRNGGGVLRAVLNARALGAARPDGMLEPRMAQLCARFGLEQPVFQHDVFDDGGRFVARVDFAYPDVRAFLEVDGYEVHGTPSAMEADFDRQNRMVALGWVPIRFGWRLLVRQPKVVAAQIDDVLTMLRAR